MLCDDNKWQKYAGVVWVNDAYRPIYILIQCTTIWNKWYTFQITTANQRKVNQATAFDETFDKNKIS